jgi:alpha-mannosidase
LDLDTPLPVQIESINRGAVLRPKVSGAVSERRGTCVRASFVAKLAPLGYQVYAVAPVGIPNKPAIAAHPSNVLENETLRVQIAANGTFSIVDKSSGRIYRDLGYFEDGGDSGDGYNYSYPLEDRVENTLGAAPRISRLNNGPVNQQYRIDYDLTLPTSLDDLKHTRAEERTACPLSITLSLMQGSPRLDLTVVFDNHARDHRFRIVFPSDMDTQVSSASAPFDVVDHPVKIVPVPDNAWVEDAPSTFPQQDWVDLSDGKHGLCLIVHGLPEYEVWDTDRHEIAITLLRAVGFLGAEYNMQTAVVGGGPTIATPEGQIQRKLTFSLSVLPHAGTWDQAEVWRQALAFNNPPKAYTTGMEKSRSILAPGALPGNHSFLSVSGRNVVLSAVKKAENGDALVLRMVNPSAEMTEASIQLPFTPGTIQPVGLDELPRPAQANGSTPSRGSDGRVRVAIAPKKIVSLRIERK